MHAYTVATALHFIVQKHVLGSDQEIPFRLGLLLRASSDPIGRPDVRAFEHSSRVASRYAIRESPRARLARPRSGCRRRAAEMLSGESEKERRQEYSARRPLRARRSLRHAADATIRNSSQPLLSTESPRLIEVCDSALDFCAVLYSILIYSTVRLCVSSLFCALRATCWTQLERAMRVI